ncbi:hypothetical protein CY34DRAFT_82123 [Suillus luteus UH-Slu-Lm8-n1]|uniref:C2H2-type domain-containing protein n=1 Tax=Suillus luteus UH-Slu-Lm8-n1 TaxID=930992 RepID=A0A0D0BJ38_9AGAM|nr:hypothetical protein CY34DRAFT_82123 [Suillus luteus UH-Slu-Lm8-n1]
MRNAIDSESKWQLGNRDKPMNRKADLDKHVRTHYKDNDAFIHTCPYANCTYKTIQKTNLQTHIGKHTGDLSHRCPECPFTTNYPSSLITHRKKSHGYKPRAGRGFEETAQAGAWVSCDICAHLMHSPYL